MCLKTAAPVYDGCHGVLPFLFVFRLASSFLKHIPEHTLTPPDDGLPMSETVAADDSMDDFRESGVTRADGQSNGSRDRFTNANLKARWLSFRGQRSQTLIDSCVVTQIDDSTEHASLAFGQLTADGDELDTAVSQVMAYRRCIARQHLSLIHI